MCKNIWHLIIRHTLTPNLVGESKIKVFEIFSRLIRNIFEQFDVSCQLKWVRGRVKSFYIPSPPRANVCKPPNCSHHCSITFDIIYGFADKFYAKYAVSSNIHIAIITIYCFEIRQRSSIKKHTISKLATWSLPSHFTRTHRPLDQRSQFNEFMLDFTSEGL